jgi:dTDP-4-dehydrorhamnose reductase
MESTELKPNLLVTGASGFLGWNVCQYAKSQWQVYGTYASHPVITPGITLIQVDLQDYSATKELFQTIQPHAVIHCAAQSSPNWCQLHPEAAYVINVTASWAIAGLCADLGIPCAFTSTDLVFDGLNPPYKETDPVCPVNVYGEQKVAAEAGMRSRYPDIAICRMPLMFGVAGAAQSFLQPFLKTLRAGNTLKLFTDEFRTPVSAYTAAQGLLLALQTVTGVIHLGGKERLSRYDFGLALANIMGFSPELIQPCKQADVSMAAPRSPDVSMDSSYAFSLGYQPLSVRGELMRLKNEL